MIGRFWSQFLSGTAIAVVLAGPAAADSVDAKPSSETDGAVKLDNPVVMPTEAPPALLAAPPAEPAPVQTATPTPAATPDPAPDGAQIARGLANPVVMPTEAPPALAAAPAATPAPGAVAPAPVSAKPAGIALEERARALESALAEQDRERVSAEEKKVRAAMAGFYAARDHEPLFTTGIGLSPRAEGAADRFRRAGEDGLDPSDYDVPKAEADATAADLAALEIAFAEAAIRYATHAQSGRFEPIRLSNLVTAKPPVTDPAEVLARLAEATDVSAALATYNPPHEGYRRLKAKLAEFGGVDPAAPKQVQVPDGPVIRPGQKDQRVAALRERLGAGPIASDAATYDESLVEAVKSFQRGKGIKPTGLVGPATLTALNETGASTDVRAADIVANMERWRWLPRDLGSMHVFVNIPEFELAIKRNGAEIHRTRVIVGKVENQTPVFSDTMDHIVVNPYWNVPVSILKKEMLDKIQATGGGYLDRGNYEVVVGSRVVSASAVDWANVNPGAVRVRQRPGGGNALGNIKFMFPNEHAVYLHDTSSRGLFSQTYRALSHGCVRVHEPFAFADALLSEEPTGLNGSKLKASIGGSEKWHWLKRKIEVHLAYFTVFVRDDGRLESRQDIYGHNAKTKRLLGI